MASWESSRSPLSLTTSPVACLGAGSDAVPSPTTPLAGLLCVGDSMFPGPGVPAVAAGGTIAAHSLVPWWKQWATLDKIGASV